MADEKEAPKEAPVAAPGTVPPAPPAVPSAAAAPAPEPAPVEVDLTSLPRVLTPRSRPWIKPQAAHQLAMTIVGVFAVSVILILVGGFLIIQSCSPEVAQKLIVEAAIPFLKEVASFASAVFAPLLAFILGYYFGEKQQS